MPQNRHDTITATEVAEILGVDPRTVQRQAAAGQLPSLAKLPGRTGAYLFSRAEIDALTQGRAA